MLRHEFLFLALLLSLTLPAQTSPTAQQMARLGFVDVRQQDSTIHVSLMYSRPDNFTGRTLYADLREAYLHPKAARALLRAQQLLRARRPDLALKVFDAARPMHIQQAMWNTVKGTPQQDYVSNPRNGGGLHNYGLAVDISLCDAQTGDTLDMGTVVDHLGPEAHTDREEALVRQGTISAQALANRLLLRDVMRQAGFTPLRTEWWHFNLVSRAEARAHYKPIP
ncbi:MAG: M15 family metallopeptidase [Bacteroidaceae bacterium]|nr:M15 family metallopeptidase [Bacteroidaceae bacterium]